MQDGPPGAYGPAPHPSCRSAPARAAPTFAGLLRWHGEGPEAVTSARHHLGLAKVAGDATAGPGEVGKAVVGARRAGCHAAVLGVRSWGALHRQRKAARAVAPHGAAGAGGSLRQGIALRPGSCGLSSFPLPASLCLARRMDATHQGLHTPSTSVRPGSQPGSGVHGWPGLHTCTPASCGLLAMKGFATICGGGAQMAASTCWALPAAGPGGQQARSPSQLSRPAPAHLLGKPGPRPVQPHAAHAAALEEVDGDGVPALGELR